MTGQEVTAPAVTAPIRGQPRVPLAPLTARRLLRFELERLVGDAGVRHHTVAEWLGVSRASVTQALTAKNLFSRPALEVLLGRLGRAEWFPRLCGLLTIARRKTGVREAAAGSGQCDDELVLGLEAFADAVTVFDPWLVPVQLRTQMYAAALTKLDSWAGNLERERRQAPLLCERDPLSFRWITSEHALERSVGGRAVKDDQRTFLTELAGRKNVEVLVIPATTELPPVSAFQIVHGPPSVVVEPSRLAMHYAHDPGTVRHFERLAEGLTRRALGAEESVELIREMRP